MTEIIILILICIIIYYILKPKLKRGQITQFKPSATTKDTPNVKVSVSIDPSSSIIFSNPDTGTIISSSDGGWILNPESTFPLTIYGIEQSIAEELKQILDNGYSQSPYQTVQNIMPIVARYNLMCKEVDDYIIKFKPIYLQKIKEQIQASSEWSILSDLDKEDLLSEFKNNAITSLDIQPDCNLEVLFESEHLDLTIDDVLIDRYGYDTMRFYLSRKKGVHIIPADHYDRKMFEKLVDAGLAVRGEGIPLEALLECLKLKELSGLVADLNPPKFSRKAKAIEYLLDVSDIKDRVKKVVSFRSLFQLQPLPKDFANIDLDKVSLSWQYAQELSYLICGTYLHAGYSTRDYHRNMENIDGDFIKDWEISIVDDSRCCPYCRRETAKKYSKKQYPKVPLHIGCRCHVSPVLRSDE